VYRVLCVVALAACGGVDTDIENRVTIDQGVYGLLLRGCDGGACRIQLGNGIGITVELPPPAGSIHGASLDATTSDDRGVYQFELPAGTYQLCTTACTAIDIPEGRARYDWISGDVGGEWCEGPC
jgi:hypothetical protein